jgi:hypothetical protein
MKELAKELRAIRKLLEQDAPLEPDDDIELVELPPILQSAIARSKCRPPSTMPQHILPPWGPAPPLPPLPRMRFEDDE